MNEFMRAKLPHLLFLETSSAEDFLLTVIAKNTLTIYSVTFAGLRVAHIQELNTGAIPSVHAEIKS